MEPIFVLDCEFRKNRSIKEIGISYVIEVEDGQFMAARPPDHHLIRVLGENEESSEIHKVSLLGACELLKNMGAQDKMWSYGKYEF